MYDHLLICDQCKRVVGFSSIKIVSGVRCSDCVKREILDGNDKQS